MKKGRSIGGWSQTSTLNRNSLEVHKERVLVPIQDYMPNASLSTVNEAQSNLGSFKA